MNILKHLTVLVILLSVVGCEESSPGPVIDPVQIEIVADQNSVAVNSVIEMALTVENISIPIFGMSCQIGYDGDFLSFNDSTGADAGELFGINSLLFARNEDSTIHLSITLIQGAREISGSGTLCKLRFTGVSAGQSPIEIAGDDLHFFDVYGNEIEFGSVDIENFTVAVQ